MDNRCSICFGSNTILNVSACKCIKTCYECSKSFDRNSDCYSFINNYLISYCSIKCAY